MLATAAVNRIMVAHVAAATSGSTPSSSSRGPCPSPPPPLNLTPGDLYSSPLTPRICFAECPSVVGNAAVTPTG